MQYTRSGGGVNPFQQYVQEFQTTIETSLDELSNFPESCPIRLKESVRYSLLAGGKRLRPLLVLLAARACGGEPNQAMPAAAAIEMIHTYSLIHDDLPAMDDDDLRRGRPTNHRQFDEATAILAGDGLLTYAFEVLATKISDPVRAIACVRELSNSAGVTGMVGGQQADIEAERRNENSEGEHQNHETKPSPLQQLQGIHRRKTGKLITCSLRMGGLLGGADDQQLAALTRYGDAIGLAFQITDDILDCIGSAELMGKGVGKDAGKDKLTYPGLMGLKDSQREAEFLINSSIEALEQFGPAAEGLRAVARFILERDR